MAVLLAHGSAPPPSLAARRPGMPAAADWVVARAPAKRPEQRYPRVLPGIHRHAAGGVRPAALRLRRHRGLPRRSGPRASQPGSRTEARQRTLNRPTHATTVARPRARMPEPGLRGKRPGQAPAAPSAVDPDGGRSPRSRCGHRVAHLSDPGRQSPTAETSAGTPVAAITLGRDRPGHRNSPVGSLLATLAHQIGRRSSRAPPPGTSACTAKRRVDLWDTAGKKIIKIAFTTRGEGGTDGVGLVAFGPGATTMAVGDGSDDLWDTARARRAPPPRSPYPASTA